jgi:hypothetical protein
MSDEDAGRRHMARFRMQVAEVKALGRCGGGRNPVISMDRVKPSRFNGSMSCTTFLHHFKAVARPRQRPHTYSVLSRCRSPTFCRAGLQKWCMKTLVRHFMAVTGITNWPRPEPNWAASLCKSLLPPSDSCWTAQALHSGGGSIYISWWDKGQRGEVAPPHGQQEDAWQSLQPGSEAGGSPVRMIVVGAGAFVGTAGPSSGTKYHRTGWLAVWGCQPF